MSVNGSVPIIADEPRNSEPGIEPAGVNVLIASKLMPWEDLNAKSIPEEWLHMQSVIVPTVSMLAVQTPSGPKLARAAADGTIQSVGSVNVLSGTIDIENAVDTQILIGSGQVILGLPTSNNDGSEKTTNIILPRGVQTIAIQRLSATWSVIAHFKVVGHISGIVYFDGYFFPQKAGTIGPVFPAFWAFDTSLDVTVSSNDGTLRGAYLMGLQTPAADFLQYYQPPWQYPNQLPAFFVGNLAVGSTQVLIPPVANQTISIFTARLFAYIAAGTTILDMLAYGPDALTLTALLYGIGVAGQFDIQKDYKGVQLPVGNGLYIYSLGGAATPTIIADVSYSRS